MFGKTRNAILGWHDFYRHLCHTLGLHPTSVAANLFLAVGSHVQELRRDKVHPVFLLDEARLLHPDMLGHLHILMNYAWDAKALLSLVLVGLPEIEANLSRRTHRFLLTRIHHRFVIAPAPSTTLPNTCAFASQPPAPTARRARHVRAFRGNGNRTAGRSCRSGWRSRFVGRTKCRRRVAGDRRPSHRCYPRRRR